MHLESVTSLKMAVQRAKAVKVIQESDFERRKGFNFNGKERNREERNDNSSNKNKKDIDTGNRNHNKDHKERKFIERKFNKNYNRKDIKECW